MNPYRLKPVKKIDELLLLVTIYSYAKEHGLPPTAEALMGLKSEFAPCLARVDTLRMWLKRHTNRTVRRVNRCRPYLYELNRQGDRRIVLLVERRLRKAILMRQLGLFVTEDLIKPYWVAHKLTRNHVAKNLLLFDLLMQSLKI